MSKNEQENTGQRVAVTIFSGWLVVTRFSVTRELGILDICLFPCVSW